MPGAILEDRCTLIRFRQIAEVVGNRGNEREIDPGDIRANDGDTALNHGTRVLRHGGCRRIGGIGRQHRSIQRSRRPVQDHLVGAVGQAGECVVSKIVRCGRPKEHAGGCVQIERETAQFPLVGRSDVEVEAIVEEIVDVVADSRDVRIRRTDGSRDGAGTSER